MEHGKGLQGSENEKQNVAPVHTGTSNAGNPIPNQGGPNLPLAGVTRIMRSALPPNVKISEDAKETVQACVSDFINVVTSRANEHCHDDRRKIVGADDLLRAMKELGLKNYAEALTVYMDRYREAQRLQNMVGGEAVMRYRRDFRHLPPPNDGFLSPQAVFDQHGGAPNPANVGPLPEDGEACSSCSSNSGGANPG